MATNPQTHETRHSVDSGNKKQLPSVIKLKPGSKNPGTGAHEKAGGLENLRPELPVVGYWLPLSAPGGSETPGNFGPVDDVPESSDVIRAAVLVVQIVRMFPNVQSENRSATF